MRGSTNNENIKDKKKQSEMMISAFVTSPFIGSKTTDIELVDISL